MFGNKQLPGAYDVTSRGDADACEFLTLIHQAQGIVIDGWNSAPEDLASRQEDDLVQIEVRLGST